MRLVANFNGKKPTSLVKATKKAFEACLVRKGEGEKCESQPPEQSNQFK